MIGTGGMQISGERYSSAGDDSAPLGLDYAVAVEVRRNGSSVVVGFADVVNEPTAAAGERRMYSRNSAGTPMAVIWLKADGSIDCRNANGYFKLESSGNFVVNGATIDTTGKITSPVGVVSPSAVIGGKEINLHIHNVTGSTTGPNL
jgi:hypothetical protein